MTESQLAYAIVVDRRPSVLDLELSAVGILQSYAHQNAGDLGAGFVANRRSTLPSATASEHHLCKVAQGCRSDDREWSLPKLPRG
jgi:hypothetical protein